jgi:hypothetical protein
LEGAGLSQNALERQVTEKLAGYTEARRSVKKVNGHHEEGTGQTSPLDPEDVETASAGVSTAPY